MFVLPPAKSTYGLTDKDVATLHYESIQGSLKTLFRHAEAKALSIRKFEALVNTDKLQFLGQAIGLVSTFTFTKTDSNYGRRFRANWLDNGADGLTMLRIREEKEKEELAEYAKSVQNKRASAGLEEDVASRYGRSNLSS